jgi:predicted dithiol-disulfide oxidoreductase (DUF899 family)
MVDQVFESKRASFGERSAFSGPKGNVGLLDLFEGRRQLMLQRALFKPGVFG